MMAIKANCGCGFQTTSLEEAQKHANVEGHTLHVLGKVTRDKED